MPQFSAHHDRQSQLSAGLTPRQLEIYQHLCEHDGPDMSGQAHPELKTVMLRDLEAALDLAQDSGFAAGLRPYHFFRTRGTWEVDEYVDEVLLKKVDSLLYGVCDGDFFKFCQHVHARDLISPLTETVGEWEYNISMLQPLGEVYNSSPYLIVMRYLELVNEERIRRDLRPYHLASASQGTHLDPDLSLEIITKKIQSLLRGHYRNNLARLCTSVTREEMLKTFEDRVGPGKVPIKMGSAIHPYRDNLYSIVLSYISAQGRQDEFCEFRPYHMSTASQATYNNPQYVTEVLVKSCKYQIAKHFGGDEKRFLVEGTGYQISEPFYEVIAGRKVKVITHTAMRKINDSSHRAKQIYKKFRSSIHLAS